MCCQDDDAGGDEDDQGGFNDLYDMDDDFIDDAELRDYFGSDRRKTKYSGFFVNKVSLWAAYAPCLFPPAPGVTDCVGLGLVQAGPAFVVWSVGCRCFRLKEGCLCLQGEIEKTDEEIVMAPESPPKRKRRVKKPEDGAAKAAEAPKKRTKRPRAEEAEDVDQAAVKEAQSKQPQSRQPGADVAAAADTAGAQAPPEPPASSAAPGSAPSGECHVPVPLPPILVLAHQIERGEEGS